MSSNTHQLDTSDDEFDVQTSKYHTWTDVGNHTASLYPDDDDNESNKPDKESVSDHEWHFSAESSQSEETEEEAGEINNNNVR